MACSNRVGGRIHKDLIITTLDNSIYSYLILAREINLQLPVVLKLLKKSEVEEILVSSIPAWPANKKKFAATGFSESL